MRTMKMKTVTCPHCTNDDESLLERIFSRQEMATNVKFREKKIEHVPEEWFCNNCSKTFLRLVH